MDAARSYRLALMTDGANPWLTLEAAELSGEQRLTLTDQVDKQVDEAETSNPFGTSATGAGVQLAALGVIHTVLLECVDRARCAGPSTASNCVGALAARRREESTSGPRRVSSRARRWRGQ